MADPDSLATADANLFKTAFISAQETNKPLFGGASEDATEEKEDKEEAKPEAEEKKDEAAPPAEEEAPPYVDEGVKAPEEKKEVSRLLVRVRWSLNVS